MHFGIETIKDLPGLQELKAAGLLDSVDTALDKMGGMPAPGEPVEDDDGQIDLEEAIAESERKAADISGQEINDNDAEKADVETEE